MMLMRSHVYHRYPPLKVCVWSLACVANQFHMFLRLMVVIFYIAHLAIEAGCKHLHE